MKTLSLSFFLLAFPLFILCQNLSGLWSGQLRNDSTQRIQNFEMGLSEYRGKITGYTYTTFIENDTFYYSVKRITAERKDGFLVVEDEKMVGNNFPEKKAKHVKQTTTFPLINDSTIDFTNGRWSTNQTKKYYSIGGSAQVKEQEDEKESDLLTHLQEMNVKTNIAVIKKKKDEPLVKNNPPEKKPIKKKEFSSGPSQVNNNVVAENKNSDVTKSTVSQPTKTGSEITNSSTDKTTKPVTIENKKEEVVLKKNNDVKEISSPPIITKSPSTVAIKNETPKNTTVNADNNAVKKQEASTQIVTQKQPAQQPIIAKTETPKKDIAQNVPLTQTKPATETVKELPATVAIRKSEISQDIYFKGDSLVLSLYDNGIVDGDTVSVFLNGENIISKQKLKEAATKKTIYITPSSPDSLQLVLFAENLGTIPPNTGLLTIRDGENLYQVRFSADLSKNASILLRRKKE